MSTNTVKTEDEVKAAKAAKVKKLIESINECIKASASLRDAANDQCNRGKAAIVKYGGEVDLDRKNLTIDGRAYKSTAETLKMMSLSERDDYDKRAVVLALQKAVENVVKAFTTNAKKSKK